LFLGKKSRAKYCRNAPQRKVFGALLLDCFSSGALGNPLFLGKKSRAKYRRNAPQRKVFGVLA